MSEINYSECLNHFKFQRDRYLDQLSEVIDEKHQFYTVDECKAIKDHIVEIIKINICIKVNIEIIYTSNNSDLKIKLIKCLKNYNKRIREYNNFIKSHLI